MKLKINSQVFEWILAQLAGFGENPADLFPSLRDADLSDLQAQLDDAIRHAKTIKAPIQTNNTPCYPGKKKSEVDESASING